jgi:hypothetical protein
VFPEGKKQQPFLKYLKDILRGCLLCFAEEATKGLLALLRWGTEGMQANPKGLLLASQTLFKISERYFKGLLRWGSKGSFCPHHNYQTK